MGVALIFLGTIPDWWKNGGVTTDSGFSVAALFVQENGCYFGIPGVDAWPEKRDARLYAGPFPVVAHPPCQRWGKMWFGQPLTVKLTGVRKKKGDDGGCFESALKSVREWGGVLEHPWGSHAWPHFGLNVPPRDGGWISADMFGGWTCCVEQGRYGHYARKPTMLYAFRVNLPELEWGTSQPRFDPDVVARMGLKRAKRLGEVGARGGGTDSAPRIGTPVEFRDLLIGMARSVNSPFIPPPNAASPQPLSSHAPGNSGVELRGLGL